MYLSLYESVEKKIVRELESHRRALAERSQARDGGTRPCLVSRMIEKGLYGTSKVEAAYLAGALLAAGPSAALYI
jgi:hypothetical protein